MDENLKLRISRQDALAPYKKLQESDCVVIGNGAVGRQVALQLASLGVKSLKLWDFDTVEIENLSPQGYKEDQLKKNKAEATASDCLNLNSSLKNGLSIENRRFAKSDFRELAGKYAFICVDSIDTRQNIYESAIKGKAKWIGDTRVAGEMIRIISEDEPVEDSQYKNTLFSEQEAFSGSCHAKMTNYSANIASGLVVGKFAQKLRGTLPSFTDHNFDLLSWDLFETIKNK